jgi:choline kinase
MKAIILAAGKGSRLNGVAGDVPKCLVRVGHLTLIERQIESLRDAGVEDIAVVVGFKEGMVREVCGPEVEYIENPIHFRTNSLYSLWLARQRLTDGFVILNSDVLFHQQMLEDLLTAHYEDALLIAYQDGTSSPLGDEEMKVKVRGGRVEDISKAISPREADGENVGIAKFGAAGAKLLVRKMDALVAKGEFRAWAPRAFRDFAAERALHAIGTRGFPWIEIDFPEDYRRAINEVLPKIEIAEATFDRGLSLAAATAGERI